MAENISQKKKDDKEQDVALAFAMSVTQALVEPIKPEKNAINVEKYL